MDMGQNSLKTLFSRSCLQMTLEDRQRIMVIGSGGAGKSTFHRIKW